MLTDPICALATSPGRAAIAIVRIAGKGALEIALGLLPLGISLAPRRPLVTTVTDPDGELIDQAVVTYYAAPRSYTGEDLIEFSCHGGMAVVGRVLAALEARGARAAGPGEFTRRAVRNGKLDLLQAEAIGDLIDATSRVQARRALHQLEGGLSRRIGELRDQLLEVMVLQSYEIDFPEEDAGPIDHRRIQAALEPVQRGLAQLAATAPLGERLRAGALVVIAGRPNAGKSSLFNALLGNSRALVTEIPGTTRDAIEAAVEIAGWPVRFVDTAGLRDTEDRLELLGIEVSRRFVAAADLVLLCVEGHLPLNPDEAALEASAPTLVVRTKADLFAAPSAGSGLSVSVVSGAGLEGLKTALVDRLFADGAGFGDVEPFLTRERHRTAIKAAAEEIDAGLATLRADDEPVLVAHHVRGAVLALEQLIGVVDVEEVLGKVFERFCVGK